jgi:F-type H+-transporting ATPase subunit alpha
VKAMKKIAGSLRLDLAAFRELEAFAQLGTELDKATQAQLDRGLRMVELLKQPQYKPYETVDQILSIYAGTKGFLDNIDAEQGARVRGGDARLLPHAAKAVRDELEQKKALDDGLVAKLEEGIKAFAAGWKG